MQNNTNIKAHRLRYYILQQLNFKTFTACNDDVCVTAVVPGFNGLCEPGLSQLRQLRRVRRSHDRDIAVTLVHAFVTSRID